MSSKRSRHLVGQLRQEITEIAQCVQRALGGNANLVWVDEVGDIFAEDVREGRIVPEHSIVGTYGMGTPLHYLEDDLRLFAHQRAANWILE